MRHRLRTYSPDVGLLAPTTYGHNDEAETQSLHISSVDLLRCFTMSSQQPHILAKVLGATSKTLQLRLAIRPNDLVVGKDPASTNEAN